MNEINIFNENKDIDFDKNHIIQLIHLSLETAKYNQVKINLLNNNSLQNDFKTWNINYINTYKDNNNISNCV